MYAGKYGNLTAVCRLIQQNLVDMENMCELLEEHPEVHIYLNQLCN